MTFHMSRISIKSFFVAGAAFGYVGVSFFVAGTVFGEI